MKTDENSRQIKEKVNENSKLDETAERFLGEKNAGEVIGRVSFRVIDILVFSVRESS